jgi:hypothetical protein
MEEVHTSDMSVSFYKTNDAISWKAVIFILAAVRI